MTIEFYPVTYVLSFNLVSVRHKMEENKNEDEAEEKHYQVNIHCPLKVSQGKKKQYSSLCLQWTHNMKKPH